MQFYFNFHSVMFTSLTCIYSFIDCVNTTSLLLYVLGCHSDDTNCVTLIS